jgi:tyrosine-specific transport protein
MTTTNLKTKTIWTNKQFLSATAVLVGTIVGVGIFGIPFAFAKAGFWVGSAFLVFACVATAVFTLLFGEVVLRTKEKHQLVGYTNLYLGKTYKRIVFFAAAVGLYGSLLAYIILAGEFLNNILSYVFYSTQFNYSIIFAIVVSIGVLLGLRTGAFVELILTLFFIGVMLTIFGFGVGHIEINNLRGANPAFWFLPYGVLLFALSGMVSVPIQRDVLAGKERLLKKSILVAVSAVTFLYFLFALTVVGVSGDVTSPDAFSGLFDVLGAKMVFLGSLFGILAITTSFLMVGIALRRIFHLDYKIKKTMAWLLVVIPPVILFLGGLRNFIDVIGIAGSVAGGIEAIIIVFVVKSARIHGDRAPEYTVNIPNWILYTFIPIFTAGIIYALFVY